MRLTPVFRAVLASTLLAASACAENSFADVKGEVVTANRFPVPIKEDRSHLHAAPGQAPAPPDAKWSLIRSADAIAMEFDRSNTATKRVTRNKERSDRVDAIEKALSAPEKSKPISGMTTIFQAVLVVLALYSWALMSVVLHEAAHVIFGRLVGYIPSSVTIGSGRGIFRLKLLNITTHVRLIPFVGYVNGYWRAERGFWWRGSVLALAGPATDALLLGGLLALAALHAMPAWPRPWNQALGIAIVYQAFSAVVSLVPFDFSVGRKMQFSDAKLFLYYLIGKGDCETRSAIKDYEEHARRYDPSFDLDKSWRVRATEPELTLLSAANRHLENGNYHAAAAKYQRALASITFPPGERAFIVDVFASLVIDYAKKEFLSAALDLIRDAHSSLPECQTLRATLGSLEVEAGHYAAGIALLEPLTAPSHEAVDRTISACYLAKACHHRGDTDRATQWLVLAKDIGARPALYGRISAEMPEAVRQTDQPGMAGRS